MRPDPTEAGHITGQNPNTPQRLPGHTTDYRTGAVEAAQADQLNEEEAGGKPAYLFRAGSLAAVTVEPSGASLPAADDPWVCTETFTLGVRDVSIPGVNPEPLIRGIRSEGYYVWRTTDASRKPSTTA